MKSKIIEDRYLIECDCGLPEHLLMFDIWDEDGYTSIDAYICSTYGMSLFRRFIMAVKFIIGKERYLYTEGLVISKKNIEDLEEVIKRIKEINKKYELC